MNKLITACFLTLGLLAGQAYAANAACEKSADDKKLAGAARTSHIKKCEKDMAGGAGSPACEKSADDKKLAGAARTSHIKKCMADGGKPAADAGKPAAAPAMPATPATPAAPAKPAASGAKQ
ncbi:MAG: hypothetical protein JNL85_06200 [Rubrivivax sp.]|nr:hypothetical protein [Rubrivivax sp.]